MRYCWDIGREAFRFHRQATMTTATIPAGIEFSPFTDAYWVRADYSLTRSGRGYILEDHDGLTTRRFPSLSAGLAALAALI